MPVDEFADYSISQLVEGLRKNLDEFDIHYSKFDKGTKAAAPRGNKCLMRLTKISAKLRKAINSKKNAMKKKSKK